MAPPFLISALDGSEWSASGPCSFTPGERAPDTHWIGGWLGPRIWPGRCGGKKNRALPGIEPGPSSA
jgi:hypothetical protein